MTPAEREFAIIVDQVRRRKKAFTQRLERHLRREGDCRIWTKGRMGGATSKVYPRMTVRYNGEHFTLYVHRLFVILGLCRPIAPGHEAGHYGCNNPLCVYHVREQLIEDNRRESAQNTNRKRGRA